MAALFACLRDVASESSFMHMIMVRLRSSGLETIASALSASNLVGQLEAVLSAGKLYIRLFKLI